MATHRNFCFSAEDSLFEFESEVLTQIGAALGPAATARTTAAKKIAKAEKVAKDVLKIVEHAGIKTSAAAGVSYSGMAKTIVEGALIRIGEHRVSFSNFLEPFLGFRLVGISIGVILQRQLAIGALDLLIAGRTNHAQHFVIVAFAVTGQNGLILLSWNVLTLLPGVLCHLHHRGTQQTVLELIPAL